MSAYGRSFGIADESNDLKTTAVLPASNGRSVVRFQQLDQGVPVIGGELVVNLDKNKNLLSANGEALPNPTLSLTPRLDRARARSSALAVVARSYKLSASKLTATAPTLWIYDSKIMGGPGLGRPALVWRMDVKGQKGPQPIDELVLVDAQLGAIALHFNQVEQAKYREVCDANNDPDNEYSEYYPCTAPTRVEGGASSSIADVNDAYDNLGRVYDFYQDYLGRDSIDGAGMHLIATTRYCDYADDCPYENAYWDGSQMVFGDGYASADDVVGHELTHGVTDHTSKLFYYYQSGAINESISDIFGEFVDLTDGTGSDSPSDRWYLGEDLPGGAIRNMADPTEFGQPDYVGSYLGRGDAYDNGEVHLNSGPGNQAAYLIVDGDYFNGQTVSGIGIAKAARIYYEAETHLLTSASNYHDLGTALTQACINLIGTAGITSSDCNQVLKAVEATQMGTPGAPGVIKSSSLCSSNTYPSFVFSDNLENPSSGNWTVRNLDEDGPNDWYYPQNPNSYSGWDPTYAVSGVTNFWGDDPDTTSESAIEMTKDVTLPASPAQINFEHAYDFDSGVDEDTGQAINYDGGMLQYSTDGGSTWFDVESGTFGNFYGSPTGVISNEEGNPLAGHHGWVGTSGGYTRTQASLVRDFVRNVSLLGKSIRFRFVIGSGSDVGSYGWFIDNVDIYTCSFSGVAFSISNYSFDESSGD
ncbi:MAG: M4 family metallopeptidase, partial [Gaiellaceae bacterium]